MSTKLRHAAATVDLAAYTAATIGAPEFHMVKQMAIAEPLPARETAQESPPPVRVRPAAGPLNRPQVVDRVVDILEAFLWLGPQLGVSELSRALGLKKATTHRLLGSLRRRDFVAQDPVTRRYRLGIKLWELGSQATSQVAWVDRAKPFLQRLTDQTGETTHLAVLDDGEVLYIDKVESTRSLRMPSQVGRRLPAHCTGVGKALLAHLPQVDVASIVARRGMAGYTKRTITDLDELHADLTEVRRRGYSVDDEEIEEALRCIGAPVRDHSGRVVAAVSIAGPAARLPTPEVERLGEVVLAGARAISTALGCPPQYLDLPHPDGAARVRPPRAVRTRRGSQIDRAVPPQAAAEAPQGRSERCLRKRGPGAEVTAPTGAG